MLVTRIKIKIDKNPQSKSKAYIDLTFDDLLAVHNLKIIDNENHFFVSMPAYRKNQGFRDVVHPINTNMREIIEKLLLAAYNYCVEEKYDVLVMNINEDSKSTDIFEQSIYDFYIDDEFSIKNDLPENIPNQIVTTKSSENETQQSEKFYTKALFNYIDGVKLKKINEDTLRFDDVSYKIDLSARANGFGDSEVRIIEWVDKLQFATVKNVYELMSANIVEKSENYIFTYNKVSNKINDLSKVYELLNTYRLEDERKERAFKTHIFTLSSKGKQFLKQIGTHPNNGVMLQFKNLMSIRAILSLNAWFTAMLYNYKNVIDVYDVNTVMDNENYIEARAKVNAYIKLNNQPFFAQSFRYNPKWDNEMNDNEMFDKVMRLAILAEDYKNITINLRNANMKKQPIIVIIGENEEHLKKLANLFCEIKTNVSIIYTHDLALIDDIENSHFEYIDGEFRVKKMNELFGLQNSEQE